MSGCLSVSQSIYSTICFSPVFGAAHPRLWIGLGGSFGIWVKIFISVIRLKLCRIVKVTYEHTLPVHMAAFMAFLSEKKRPKWTLS